MVGRSGLSVCYGGGSGGRGRRREVQWPRRRFSLLGREKGDGRGTRERAEKGGGEEIVCLSFGLHDFDTQNK